MDVQLCVCTPPPLLPPTPLSTAANIPVIGFNAVLMSEHMASFFVFGLLHAALAIQYIEAMLPPRAYQGALDGGVGVGDGACAWGMRLGHA